MCTYMIIGDRQVCAMMSEDMVMMRVVLRICKDGEEDEDAPLGMKLAMSGDGYCNGNEMMVTMVLAITMVMVMMVVLIGMMRAPETIAISRP